MSVMDSLKKTFNFDEDYETFRDEVDASVEAEEDNVIKPSFFRRREKETLRTVPLKQSAPEETGQAVDIMRPDRFEDAMTIVDELKDGRIVVINTSQMELKVAQRLLDFVSGSTYSLAGDIQEVMEAVYIVTPCGVSLKSSIRTESVMKSIFGMK